MHFYLSPKMVCGSHISKAALLSKQCCSVSTDSGYAKMCCVLVYQYRGNREFKEITTAGATMAVVTEKVWGEYASLVCQILSLASKAKYKDERNIGYGV